VSEKEPEDGPAMPDEVVVPLEDHLDLHAFAPRDVRSVTEAYLERAIEAGWTEVRLIHGRGVGVQREIVRSLLSRHPGVAGFRDAPPARGGWGATIVELAPARPFDGSADSGENGVEGPSDGGKR
jgi:dsDNA-specific endonuclease/ATPase MutS2